MTSRPVLLALALDHDTNDVVRAAAELASRMQAPLAAVHALAPRALETEAHLGGRIREARDRLLLHLAPAEDEGCIVLEPVVARERAAGLAMRTALSLDAQMIVTGGGSPPTVRRWVLGSTAEQIVRSSPVPVFVARGTRHEQGVPIVCPIDLSAQSRTGLMVAARLARLFGSSVLALHVIAAEEHGWLSSERLEHELERVERAEHERLERFLAGSDLSGVEVIPRVVVGDPAQRVIEASERAWLLVIGSRGFTELLPGAIGRVTERALRFSRCSAVTVRDSDPARDEREARLRELGGYKQLAVARIAAGEHARALPLLEVVAAYAPADASVQELMADALAALGRADEAERHRELANVIRASFG